MDSGVSENGHHHSKRRFGRALRGWKKVNIMKSDVSVNEDNHTMYEEENNGMPIGVSIRSNSLSALNNHNRSNSIFRPRMTKLETLEAKMARIENSLSTTPKKKRSFGSGALIGNNTTVSECNPVDECRKSILCQSFDQSPPPLNTSILYRTSKDITKELDSLKNALKDKENTIISLKDQLNHSLGINNNNNNNNNSNNRTMNNMKIYNNNISEKEKKMIEEKVAKLKQEIDSKRQIIKNIKFKLENLDVTDNIDVRIQQAELEYQLGTEELNLLTLTEKGQVLQMHLQQFELELKCHSHSTIFNYIEKYGNVKLYKTWVLYDEKSPKFGISIMEDGYGPIVDWACNETLLKKADRLFEINGKIVTRVRTKEDVIKLLQVSPNGAQIVIMRGNNDEDVINALQQRLIEYSNKLQDKQLLMDTFKNDNIRLTHRISYLEEQVNDLISSSNNNNNASSKVQIFQKGSKVSTTCNNNKAREFDINKRHNNNVSNTTIGPPAPIKPIRLSLHKGCSLQSVKIIDKTNSIIDHYSDSDINKHVRKRNK